jgi:segregation and condensation protein B
LRSLFQRGLVEEVGRLEAVGRPILYGVTDRFLQHFGLMAMSELPPLERAEAERLEAVITLTKEDGDDPVASGQLHK